MSVGLSFYWYDYIIFITTLAVSTSIGIYYGCFGTKQSTINEYLMGNKKMKFLPIALSIAVSHFSGITILGVAADVYKYGASYWLTCLSMIILIIVIAYVYLPVFFGLNLTSLYEYLEKRFDKKTKLFASFLYVLTDTVFCPLLAYSPALALSTATGIDVHVISFVICATCVFYTAIGGLRTVIWTDLFQLGVIIGTLIVVIIAGVHSGSSFLTVWNTGIEGGRLDIFDFDINPTKRDSFWILLIGFTAHWVNYIALTQAGAQKFLTLPSLRDCLWSIVYFAISMNVVVTLCVFIGLLIYAKYSSCDPVLNNHIKKHDELVYYYIADITKNIPGISGLFLAALVCGSLSSLSCSFNAMSGVIYKDFVSKFLKTNVSEKKATNILKLIVLINGVICTGLVLFMEHLGEIVPLAISFTGMIVGPSMGMFTLGILFPKANAKGAFYGAMCGFLAMLIITTPAKYYRYHEMFSYPSKTLSTYGCANHSLLNNTFLSSSTNSSAIERIHLPFIFRISYYYYCLVGALVTILLGLAISYLTNKNDPVVNKMLISPLTRFLLQKENRSDEQQALQNLMQ